MFGGGIHRGSATLLIGPSGSGKSTLAMMYAYAAAKRGDRAIVYAFDEVLRTAQDRMDGLGMPVRDQIERGTLAMSQVESRRTFSRRIYLRRFARTSNKETPESWSSTV